VRAAKSNPIAFAAWWAYYTAEWIKPGGAKSITEMPDPLDLLPFILVPNSSARFFDATIRINNLGFRGPDIRRDKGDYFRIVALGESPTFGPSLFAHDRPWPEVLNALLNDRLSCLKPVEVINAGTEMYNLTNNLERLRRDIIPLRPDVVISYHGANDTRGLFGPEPFSSAIPEDRSAAPSALLRETIRRVKRVFLMLSQNNEIIPIYTHDQVFKSGNAEAYRKLITIAQENNFRLILSTSSFAVTGSSPREAKDFYALAFPEIDESLVRHQAYNDLVRVMASDNAILLVDTSELNGLWDDDFYLDLVHFTQAGNNRMAEIMFSRLASILREDPIMRCSERNSATLK